MPKTETVPHTSSKAARAEPSARIAPVRMPTHPERGVPASEGARHAAGPVREAKQPRAAGVTTDLAQKVVNAFNTWAFKREQPSDLTALLKVVGDAVACRAPVGFVLYWGKGRRCFAGEPESQTLDYLARLAERVKSVYPPGASITLILTDTHAGLNGHSPACIDQYYGSVEPEARKRGFSICRLGALVDSLVDDGEPLDEVCLDTVRKLHGSAEKWYRGDGTPEDGALQYYRLNMVEKRAVEHAFPHAIFVTFNGSELRQLFPQNLPIFYMYSLRRGVGVKPWFLQAAVPACCQPSCSSTAVCDIDLERP